MLEVGGERDLRAASHHRFIDDLARHAAADAHLKQSLDRFLRMTEFPVQLWGLECEFAVYESYDHALVSGRRDFLVEPFSGEDSFGNAARLRWCERLSSGGNRRP